MRKLLALAFIAMVVAGVLAGCSSSSQDTTPSATARTNAPQDAVYPPPTGLSAASPYPPPTEARQNPTAPPATQTGPSPSPKPDLPLQVKILLPLLQTGEEVPPIERVLLISIDGLRPDAIASAQTDQINAPFLYSLSQSGAVSWKAQTVTPSTTLPGHASMLSGYDVAGHGVDIFETMEIFARDPYLQVPTVFELAHDHGLRTVMIAGKNKMSYFVRPDSLDEVIIFDDNNRDRKLDRTVALQARRTMKDGFDLMFLHFPDVDATGHEQGWLSKKYLGTLGRTDKAIRDVIEKLEDLGIRETTLIIITADHGGDDRDHTASGPQDVTIPWIVIGPGVRPGTDLTNQSIRTMDTAATILWALGLPIPYNLTGRPILEAFSATLVP